MQVTVYIGLQGLVVRYPKTPPEVEKMHLE